MKINKICIVGGGSSGWMTAAGLSKHFPEIEFSLIESDIDPVGVGESTLGHFNQYLDFLDYIKTDENIIVFNKYYGSNLKNISGLYQEKDIVTFYFSDGSTKKFSDINFDQFEKLITEE